MAEWPTKRGLDTANGEMLADAEISFDVLDSLAVIMDRLAVNAVVRWAAAGCAV